MPSWTEIEAHLRASWPVAIADASWCGLVVRAGGEAHRVALKPTAAPPRLIVAVRVCGIDALIMDTALRYNGSAEHGMLMLEGRSYVLRNLVPLATLTLDALDELLESMILEAARLRAGIVAVPRHGHHGVFAHFGE